jgi:hypothetical protein
MEAARRSGVPYDVIAKADQTGGSVQTFAMNMIHQLGPAYRTFSDMAVGTLPMREFNAAAMVRRTGHRIVVITWGLLDILTGLALDFIRAASSSKDLTKRQTKVVVKSASSLVFHLPTKRIEESDPRWKSEPEDLEHHREESDIRRFVNTTVNVQMEFVLCHEFAHIILNHSPASKAPVGTGLSKYAFVQGQEYEADRHAAKCIRQLHGGDFAIQFTREGIYSLFRLMDLAEQVEKSPFFVTSENSRSHPRASQRWEKLASIFGPPRSGIMPSLYRRVYDYATLAVEEGNKEARKVMGLE